MAKFGIVFDRVAAPTTEISAAFRLLDTFGAERDMVVDAEFRDVRKEFGRRFFVSLIVTT